MSSGRRTTTETARRSYASATAARRSSEARAWSVERRAEPRLEALSDALLSVTAERSVESILQKLVHAARELAGARYAALGVPDGEGGFAQFITSGMSEKLIAAMGPLPRTHGLLGLMLESEEPYRAPDIHAHPRFRAGGRAPTPTCGPSSACRSSREPE